MALTNIWYKILDLLYVKEKSTYEELRLATDCSLQTIKKNIVLLNEKLDTAAYIHTENNTVHLEIQDFTEFQKIIEGSLRSDVDFNSPHKRISFIIKNLLESGEYVTLDDFAEDLSVSRGTVVKDVKELKEIIKQFGISLLGVTNKGLRFEGDELKFRLLIQQHVYDYYKSDYSLLDQTIGYIEELKKQYRLDYSTGTLLKMSTAISIQRIKQGHHITEPIQYYIDYEGKSPVMIEFRSHLEAEYGLSMNDYDFGFVIYPVNTRTTSYVESERMEVYENNVYDIFHEMIKAVKQQLSVEIDEDELFHEMKYHLMFMLNRLIFHISIFDILSEEIQKKYPLAYELVKISSAVLEDKLGIEVNYIEKSYLAIYFESAIHSLVEKNSKKIAVICSTGKGTVNLIKKKLMEVLDFEVEIYQYSETEALEIDFYDFFAIFTTIPLEIDFNIPVIRVTSLFDTQGIREKFARLSNEQVLMDKTVDFSFFKLDDERTYTQNIINMVEALYDRKKVHVDFLHALLEREKKQTTVFDSGIGLPHTVNREHYKIIFSMGVFPQGIMEQGKEVRIVFLIGIPEEITEENNVVLMKLYDYIFHIGKKKNIYDNLLKLENEKQFMEFIRKGVF